MGTSLTGLTPSTTYDALIKVGDNGPITSTLKTLSDGLGNDLPMEASTTAINFTNGLQQNGVAVPTASQVNAKQDTLVSGTNIKTINGTSVLGSGNIVTPTTNPSGVAGAIQFSNGSAFASDASNLFWDDTNNRLGIGTNAPNSLLNVIGVGVSGIRVNTGGGDSWMPFIDNNWYIRSSGTIINDNGTAGVSIGVNSPNIARLFVKGSGSTSATTSLLVQNSAGSNALQINDDRAVILNGSPSSGYVIDANGSNASARFGNCAIGTWGVGGIFSIGSTNSTAVRLATNNTSAIYLDTNQSVNIGTVSAVASAKLQVDSTTQGFLPPRMTTTQKNAIATPAAGLVVYDSTTNKLQCYNGSTWNDLF